MNPEPLKDQEVREIRARLGQVRHDERWEILKPFLWSIFDTLTVVDIARNMESLYGFVANEAAYRHRFKVWRWKKNIPSAVKEKAIKKIQRRTASGKPSHVTLAGQPLDLKRLKRHVRSNLNYETAITDGSQREAHSQARTLGDFLPFGNRIAGSFVNWNMPFGLKTFKHGDLPFGTSPTSMQDTSPNSVQVSTPMNYKTPPADHTSPEDYVSPRSLTMQRRTAVDRADLFLRGKFDEVVSSMSDAERVVTSKWLYQFWHFSFVTSKYWGRGPRFWTAEDLQFEEYEGISFASTVVSPGRMDWSPGPAAQIDALNHQTVSQPTMFCKYAIHIVHQRVEDSNYDETDDAENAGLNEEWPVDSEHVPVHVQLSQALQNNDFSTIAASELPLAINHIARAAEKSPSELLGESMTFAIMARNLDLVNELMRRAKQDAIDLTSTYFLHVATSYLDGGSTCCMILDYLCYWNRSIARQMYINEHGHTVLDNLILTILKSHSKTPLDAIDDTLKRQPRFAGIEVDLCGRWDADDHCYRSLLQSGKTEIPFDWKHKFCHTSVQVIYHCIVSLHYNGLPIDTDSGIFVKYCTSLHCGRKLQLKPLHALVLATFRLAVDGCEDEDLFGMSAVLLCLVSCGLKSYESAHISVPLLFGDDVAEGCTHQDLTPLQLAQSLPQPVIALWGQEKKVGWRLFCQILRLAHDMQNRPESLPDSVEGRYGSWAFTSGDIPQHERDGKHCMQHFPLSCDAPCYEDREELDFEYSNDLGHLWAAFQAEILTHRKQTEDDLWVSPRLDMKELLCCLEKDNKLSIPLLDDNMLLPYCRCGRFEKSMWAEPVLREGVMKFHFGNLDIWERSTYLDVPPRLIERFYC